MTDAAKRRRGNPGRRKLGPVQPPAPPEAPAITPPRNLDATAVEEWHRVVAILEGQGRMRPDYRACLAQYCVAWSTWVRATSEIARSGELIRHKESPEDLKLGRINRPQPHPLLSVARAASNELCRLSAELGLTPSTWSRVAVDTPVDLSDFEKFRNERRR